MARNEITPSKDQIDVIEDFKWFLQNNNKDILIIRGGAGVGKTTLIQEFAKEAKNPELETDWTVIPLGNWARSTATIQQITNIPAITINEFIKETGQARKNNTSFLENLIKDRKIVKRIPVNKLKKLFNLGYHTKKINIIFKRALKK